MKATFHNKNKNLMKLLSVFAVFSLTLFSCGKDDVTPEPEPEVSCKITTLSVKEGNNSQVVRISYNNDGDISQVVRPEDKLTWTYSGNGFVFTKYNSSNQRLASSLVERNAQGKPIRITREEFGPASQNLLRTETRTFVYNSRGEVIEINSVGVYASGETYIPSPQTMTWSGGNMVELVTGSSTQTLEYYTDKPVQVDFLWFSDFFSSGTPLFFNANLVKSMSDDFGIYNFSYEFDEDGKIEKMIASHSVLADDVEISYSYDCE